MARRRTAKTTAVTTTTSTVPAYLDDSTPIGTEHLTTDDVQMPRLSLAQAMSDQVNATHADHIEGLKVGDFFNSVSGQVYGSPLRFSILCAYAPRGIEFAPMEQGGGVVDPHVPLTDPRMLFGANGEAPQATRFYDYVLMINPGSPNEEMIAMSLARSGVRAAKSLNGLFRMRGTAIFTGIYTAESVSKTAQQGTYMGWRFRNAGFIAEESVQQFADLHAGLKSAPVSHDAPTLDS
jgi:hypothetical protein